MIQYVFWDSDNTLINTAEHHWRKHFETLKTLDINLDDQHRQAIYTHNGHQNWTWINAELGLKMNEQEYLDKIDAWYFDHIDEIQIRPGVAEAIELFEKANIPQAVISNGRKKSVMAAQNAKGLATHFEFILCKEDYEGRKPDPDPYLAGINMMEEIKKTPIPPTICLAIEDDPKGVQSAIAANMKVIDRPPVQNETEQNAANFIQQCKSYLA